MSGNTNISFTPEGAVKPSSIEVDIYEGGVHAYRFTEIPSNMQLRGEYSSPNDGQPDYLGYAPKGLASSAAGWLLQKFTYDAYRQCTLRQVGYDSWDNRASASYS